MYDEKKRDSHQLTRNMAPRVLLATKEVTHHTEGHDERWAKTVQEEGLPFAAPDFWSTPHPSSLVREDTAAVFPSEF